ncbi:matrixin family metalloprotease [Vampirovibrio chlorellavorus]|uniref:matrixin family metalloprotease n=1 Tax=Vampirovibrio chlorellavorus TaxID=758823 RepID=UPI0026F2CE34|nr:matrixin family metalloprotease [Vampirovibrio chlorellavorus]
MERTYLDQCLKDGLTVRWPDSAMPLKVYVAPFRWYEKSKQNESYAYNQMVFDAFELWSKVSEGRVRFQQVAQLDGSQIDVSWRRVDRKSLGHCQYLVNQQSLLYSAEIKIGISDGLVHGQYNDMDEVKHTILHEIAHALGLIGHSDAGDDIMYVPHQYGVVNISQRDIDTLKTLYKLPPAFDYLAVGRKFKLKEPFTLHQVLDHLEGRSEADGKKIDFIPPPPPENPAVLQSQHDILSHMGKFHLATQNIKVDPALKKMFLAKKQGPPLQ